jgi:ribonuclease HI
MLKEHSKRAILAIPKNSKIWHPIPLAPDNSDPVPLPEEATICRDILELLRSLPIEPGRVQMFWSPAHSGIYGNERADKKAGMASKQAKDLANFPFARPRLALTRHSIPSWDSTSATSTRI